MKNTCLTVADLMERLKISRPTAYALIHKEGFPVLRIGRRVLIPEDALQTWLEKQVIEHAQ